MKVSQYYSKTLLLQNSTLTYSINCVEDQLLHIFMSAYIGLRGNKV